MGDERAAPGTPQRRCSRQAIATPPHGVLGTPGGVACLTPAGPDTRLAGRNVGDLHRGFPIHGGGLLVGRRRGRGGHSSEAKARNFAWARRRTSQRLTTPVGRALSLTWVCTSSRFAREMATKNSEVDSSPQKNSFSRPEPQVSQAIVRVVFGGLSRRAARRHRLRSGDGADQRADRCCRGHRDGAPDDYSDGRGHAGRAAEAGPDIAEPGERDQRHRDDHRTAYRRR